MLNQFDNISDAYLADEYGNLKAQADSLDERIKLIRDEIVARQAAPGASDRIEGSRFTVTVAKQSTARLDTKALKAALGESIIREYEKTSESTVLRVKATAVFGQAA
ncbi:MAG: hypothetical protein K2Q06_03580 [Parvularculaceae bacterium]|nr:hypothetical protein [Parvularculaceae bacterium]